MNDLTPIHAPPAPVSEPDLSGRQLGDYRLLRRLGRGGMAEVYLAEQGSLRRQVAFKVLRRSLAGDPAYVRRFTHEAQAAASLVHANIVQVHEVGCVEGVHFIVQEYVPGRNLKQVLAKQGTVDAALAVVILRQAAAALAKAGQHGIVHRDIKPENIMLSSNGDVKVTDFGLARVISDGAAQGMTQVGVTMGTPLYMSPEQVQGQTLDQRSDIYSLGVTAYQMLAGRTPFIGETALAIAVQHMNNEAPGLETHRPDLPGALVRLVHKMLAKKPDQRPASGAQLLVELRSLAIDATGAESWPSDLDSWSDPQLLAQMDARHAATQRLAKVMGKSAGKTSPALPWWMIATGIFAAFAVGGVLALVMQ